MKWREKYIEAFRKMLPQGISDRAINACEDQGWPKFDPGKRLRWLIDSFEWTKTPEGWDYWHEVSIGNFIDANDLVPVSPLPDYRSLYEQEKAIRMAAEKMLCDQADMTIDEWMEAFDNYQQLKQQYGQNTGTPR